MNFFELAYGCGCTCLSFGFIMVCLHKMSQQSMISCNERNNILVRSYFYLEKTSQVTHLTSNIDKLYFILWNIMSPFNFTHCIIKLARFICKLFIGANIEKKINVNVWKDIYIKKVYKMWNCQFLTRLHRLKKITAHYFGRIIVNLKPILHLYVNMYYNK